MGRLFDGEAALLDLKAKQSHEAEAAMLLEASAKAWLAQSGQAALQDYLVQESATNANLTTASLVHAILQDIAAEKPVGAIAASFHYTLVRWVRRVAKQQGYRSIAFSGGVFQNALLVDLCVRELRPDFKLYFHERLSPNDENIAFGQLVWFDIQQRRQARSASKELANITTV
jgi:hydrogenase maturation protein HypF